MAALSVVPVRPVTVEKVFGDMRFDFVLFLLCVTRAVAIVVFTVRINAGGECESLSVRRPFHDVRSRGKMRQWFGFASFHRERVNLRVARPRREKRNALSVR